MRVQDRAREVDDEREGMEVRKGWRLEDQDKGKEVHDAEWKQGCEGGRLCRVRAGRDVM